MSRYTVIKHNGNTIAYGFDHECGYFCQEFDFSSGDLIMDKDSLFNKLTGVKLAELVEQYADQDHLEKMYLDLPF